jgi:hypothetical protein
VRVSPGTTSYSDSGASWGSSTASTGS